MGSDEAARAPGSQPIAGKVCCRELGESNPAYDRTLVNREIREVLHWQPPGHEQERR